MGYLHSVSIQNVTFYEPDSDLSAIIKRSSKKRRLTNLIISLAGTLIFTAVFYFSIHSLLVSGIVLLIFLPSLISAIVSFVKKPCGGVRFGTVLDYYTRTVHNDIKDTSQTYEYISIRLDDRNIELSDEQIDRLNEGTQKANAKGINESLVLVDEIAFIVNIKNNTVITAMDQSEAKENVFTNIDGAVIA